LTTPPEAVSTVLPELKGGAVMVPAGLVADSVDQGMVLPPLVSVAAFVAFSGK